MFTGEPDERWAASGLNVIAVGPDIQPVSQYEQWTESDLNVIAVGPNTESAQPVSQYKQQAALREKIALACRIIGGEDVSRVSFGHVSARSEHDSDVIAMRGRTSMDAGLQFCTTDDIVEMDLQGEPTGEFTAKAPREKWAHLSIYAARPDVGAVVHVHPRWVVALTIAGKTFGPIYGAYDPSGLQLGAGGIATFPSSILIDSPEAGADLVSALGSKSACVLTGHGIVTVGTSVEAAVLEAIALTELAHMTWLAEAVGGAATISVAEQLAILGDQAQAENEGAVADRGVKPSYAAWHHYALRDQLRAKPLSPGSPS